MRALLNVIWLIFGGLWLAIGYVIAGIVYGTCYEARTRSSGVPTGYH